MSEKRLPTAADGRAALLHVTAQAAKGADPAAPWVEKLGRTAWAFRHLAENTDDSDLVNHVVDESDRLAMKVAEAPAMCPRQLAAKLAVLTHFMLEDFSAGDGVSVQRLALAASALADAVIIGGGPIELPEGAREGLREGDTVTAAAWRARARASVHA